MSSMLLGNGTLVGSCGLRCSLSFGFNHGFRFQMRGWRSFFSGGGACSRNEQHTNDSHGRGSFVQHTATHLASFVLVDTRSRGPRITASSELCFKMHHR